MALDIIFAICAVWGFYIGFSKGIIETVFTTLSIIFGLIVGFKFAPDATRFLTQITGVESPLMFVAGFLLAFVLTMALIRLFAAGLENLLEAAHINIINRVAGGLLLASIFILLYSVLLWFADQSHLVPDDTKAQSLTYDYVKEFPGKVREVYEMLAPDLRKAWEESVEMIDRLKEETANRTESEPYIFDIDEEEEQPAEQKPQEQPRMPVFEDEDQPDF